MIDFDPTASCYEWDRRGHGGFKMAGLSDEQMFGPPTQPRLVMMVPIMRFGGENGARTRNRDLAAAPLARQTGRVADVIRPLLTRSSGDKQ